MKRRDFVRRSLCAAVSSAAFTSIATKLNLAHAATPQIILGGAGSYRALVCVFLYGGNDSFNMVVPRDTPHYNIYNATRAAIALPQNSLLTLTAQNAAFDGALYGLHPSMPELAALFNQPTSPVAITANVGPLLYPINQAQYQNSSVPTPAQLFSHSDQQLFWQTPSADASGRTGWGGRLADLTTAIGQNPNLSMNISLDGENVFEAGETVIPYFVSPNGVENIDIVQDIPGWTEHQQRRAVLNALMNGPLSHPLERAYAAQFKRTVGNFEQVDAALQLPPNAPMEARFAYADANGGDYLGQQLRMVARLINRRTELSMTRQIFFVGIGGFDNHDTQLQDQAPLFASVSKGLTAFYQAMTDLSLADSVTAFTASEFGRTLTNNGDGTDHGWGGHHLVVGGAVQGGRYYGNFPSLAASNNPDNANYGQIIPTTSADQYAWTLARWYGLADTDRDLIFPNVSRFGGSNHHHLDFLGA